MELRQADEVRLAGEDDDRRPDLAARRDQGRRGRAGGAARAPTAARTSVTGVRSTMRAPSRSTAAARSRTSRPGWIIAAVGDQSPATAPAIRTLSATPAASSSR